MAKTQRSKKVEADSGPTAPKGALVRAVLHTHYGSPDLLKLREVDKPAPKDNEVLIRIHATTVSTGDCNVRNFTFVTKSMRPIAKLMVGIGKPWRTHPRDRVGGGGRGSGSRRYEIQDG